jgi:hypothetical protein
VVSSPSAPSETIDPTLAAEQRHLADARAALARMRARAEALDSAAAGDWVSQKFLESAFELRRRALADDPTVPLFFGRLDYRPDGGPEDHTEYAGESFHVGRRHVNDDEGEPLVVDWRAPVSLPFYRASPAEPMGVALRRRFGFVHGQMTGFEDETLRPEEEHAHSAIQTPAGSPRMLGSATNWP